MKKFLSILALIALAGCAPAAEVEQTIQEIAIEPPCNVNLIQLEPTPEPPFAFDFGNTTINLNQNISEIIPRVGEPLGIHQTPSCAFEGYDRIFRFPGIQLHTFPQGDNDFIQIISLWDDSITTQEGVYIGASWSDVLATYGTNFYQEMNMKTFTRGNTTLSFYVQNNQVIEITYALIM